MVAAAGGSAMALGMPLGQQWSMPGAVIYRGPRARRRSKRPACPVSARAVPGAWRPGRDDAGGSNSPSAWWRQLRAGREGRLELGPAVGLEPARQQAGNAEDDRASAVCRRSPRHMPRWKSLERIAVHHGMNAGLVFTPRPSRQGSTRDRPSNRHSGSRRHGNVALGCQADVTGQRFESAQAFRKEAAAHIREFSRQVEQLIGFDPAGDDSARHVIPEPTISIA